MNETWILLCALIAGLVTFFISRKASPSKKKHEAPDNKAADAARDTVEQTFEDSIDGIQSGIESDDPAGALADKGNARSRR